ncbi:BlaI/MecI/CopY family transcriptional regulator [Gimesia fumaroli]|jgi:predicted transcriptional regulator|uniref:Methicillin resistance regulatory protein MecI n=1 Tax=Gimesia fumaroli TaxID=2527976 RepID=A0A518IFC6_9PLAN|nr:BlaI/MecI/CopY family transcriptional regulator [Gimesia fumaroli]QDV51801.1 Methicillin resistance regulatory protein MecI [Gimesia fumaroli]
MARQTTRYPTELELEILKRLWQQGPLSGHAIRDALSPEREVTYQSVMTILGIMEEKGYVKRKKTGGSYLYRASVTEKATSKRMLHDLVARVFHGSAAAAMLNLLETSDLSDEDLSQLREIVNRRNQE